MSRDFADTRHNSRALLAESLESLESGENRCSIRGEGQGARGGGEAFARLAAYNGRRANISCAK